MKLKSENFVQLVTTHKTKFLSLDPSLGDQKWFTKVKIAARSTEIGRAVYESVKGKLIKLFDDCESITNMGCAAFVKYTRLTRMSLPKIIRRTVSKSVKEKLIKLFDGCESITNIECAAFDRCTRLASMSVLKTGRKTSNGCTHTVFGQKKGGGNPKTIYRKMFQRSLLPMMIDKHQLCNTDSFNVQSYITS